MKKSKGSAALGAIAVDQDFGSSVPKAAKKTLSNRNEASSAVSSKSIAAPDIRPGPKGVTTAATGQGAQTEADRPADGDVQMASLRPKDIGSWRRIRNLW